MSRAIEATVAPFLPSFLISSILSTPIISSLAPNRRNRSNDNGRPNGMVGVPALRPETFSRLFPKNHRARTRKTEAIKHRPNGGSSATCSGAGSGRTSSRTSPTSTGGASSRTRGSGRRGRRSLGW